MRKIPYKKDLKGQGLTEYILILAIIVIGTVATLQITGYSVRDVYCAAIEGLGGTAQTCQTEQVYCDDGFDNLDNWTSQYGGWTNQDGKMCTSAGAKNYSTCSQNMDNMSDYTVYISGAELTKGNGYGVFFRGTDMGGRTDGYIVQYDPGWRGGAIIMRKWINGRETAPFATKRLPGYAWYNEPHDLKIDVRGNTFTVYLDGEEVLIGQDDTYTEGGVGTRSWDNTTVCFDGIKVSEVSAQGEE